MKKQLLNIGLVGLMALFTSVATATPITDVQEHANNTATEYFVDVDGNKYNDPYYRNMDQDWEWVHNGIAGSGFSSIVLEISAFDVDFDDGELDMIDIWDGSTWIGFGDLAGASDIWAFTEFDLTGFAWAEAQVNAGLQVRMDIDSADTGSWWVTLGKATLSIDGGSQNCVPTPGVPCTSTDVPEPTGVALLGLGLVAMGWSRKRQLSK